MIPSRITAQVIITRGRWSDLVDGIKEYWDQDYYITDFDYGDDRYRVVLSKGTGWSGQTIKTGRDFPKDKVTEGWDKGYYITNVTHDGQDWIVVMSGVPGVATQSWSTRTKWSDFKDMISQKWEEGYIVSKIACEQTSSYDVYCAIFTKYNHNCGQTWMYRPGNLLARDLQEGNTNGKIVTDIFDVDGGAMILATSNTGYTQQKIHKDRDWEKLSALLKNRWDEDYSVTTIGYYNNEWILVFSK